MNKIFAIGKLMPVLVLLIASCNKEKAVNTITLPYDLNISTSATLGMYLTTKQGLSLYMFANDADGANTCTGGCEATWPVFTADIATATMAPGLTAGDFSNITTANGKKQLTYKGWPLYTYAPTSTNGYGNTFNRQENAGSTSGDGVGGTWFVAKPDYTIMLANKQLKGLDGNNYKSDYTIGAGITTYFTNEQGKTIYIFTIDSFNINKFTKPDLSNNNIFPIFEQDKVVVPSILDKTLFGKITTGGRTQMTYKGWPLYRFGQDTVRGLTLAVSVPVAGKWPVAVKNVEDPKRLP